MLALFDKDLMGDLYEEEIRRDSMAEGRAEGQRDMARKLYAIDW